MVGYILQIEYSLSLSEIITLVLTILVTGLGYIIKRQHDKLQEVKNQLSEKKYDLYYELLSMIFDTIKKEKGMPVEDGRDLGHRIIDVKKPLILYAPDPILRKFIEWTRYTNNNPSNDPRHFLIYLQLIELIRKDMGQPKTSFVQDDFWNLIMTTDEEIRGMKIHIATYKPGIID
jgi:hypothetical protein